MNDLCAQCDHGRDEHNMSWGSCSDCTCPHFEQDTDE